MSYLGIDLGTSGLRALLVDQDGTPIGSTERHYQVQNPHPGWSEQNPLDWVEALEGAVAELRTKWPEFSALKGIGVAGHMHGATLLDQNGDVLRPCILWNDTRSHVEAAKLDQTPGVRDVSGNIVFPGFTSPKLAWVKKHEPQVFLATAKVLLPAAYMNFYLTGEYVADMSDSAGTSWLDVGQREWSDHLLSLVGLSRDHMPRLVEGSDAAGELRQELKDRWGLSQNVIVAGGAGDNAAAACGIGALDEGQGFVSLGTSGVLLTARDGYRPAPETAVHTFCHALPNRWYQMGVMLSATDSLNWLSRMVGKSPSDLTAALGQTVAPPGKVRFLPYLSGERTPHNDAEIRGSFTGLSASTTQEDLTRAVLEGVAFALRDNFEALSATGVDLQRLVAIGGGSASAYWLKLIATVLGVDLDLPKSGEFGAALGAARLGRLASAGQPSEQVIASPEFDSCVTPQSENKDSFEEAYQAFRRAYADIKSAQ